MPWILFWTLLLQGSIAVVVLSILTSFFISVGLSQPRERRASRTKIQ